VNATAGAPGAVVVGGYINALGLVRALGARGIPVAVIVTKPFDIAHRSRWARSHDLIEGLADSPERLVDLLRRRSGDWPHWLVIPTNDEALRALAQYRDRLSAYRLACPEWDVARYFLDKARMLAVTQAIGIPAPQCYGSADASVLESRDLRYPLVIKPVSSYPFVARFGTKLFVAKNRDELRTAVTRLSEAGLHAQVYDLIPGDDSHIYVYCTYIDTRGEPRGGLTIRKLRQAPPFFGNARVAEITPDRPDLCEMTVELLRRIGFRGIAAMEFKLDPRDATFRFMEVNGRSVVYNGLLRRAGMDVAGLLWADHVNGVPERVQPNNWAGVWVHFHADLLYSLLYRRHDPVSIRRFLAPYSRPTIDAVWSANDPAPSLAEWLWSARRGAGALRRSGRRKLLANPTVP
jgi:predicted ATP-grasp superfamily ATP-dependent carboligase